MHSQSLLANKQALTNVLQPNYILRSNLCLRMLVKIYAVHANLGMCFSYEAVQAYAVLAEFEYECMIITCPRSYHDTAKLKVKISC